MDPIKPTPALHAKKKQRGQGMSEYIILTALLAIAGIGAFSALGDTISSQAALMATEIAGQDGSDVMEQSAGHAERATDIASDETNLQNFNEHD